MKHITIFLVLLFTGVANAQDSAIYVNTLIGAGINAQGVIEGGAHAWTYTEYETIKDAGFQSLRIVYEPGASLSAITESTLAVLKTIIDMSIETGLLPILDYHITPLWFQENYSSAQEDIFISNWGTMANYFSAYKYNELVFDLVNEPNAITASQWNNLLDEAITGIRSYDTSRIIMVSPLYYSHIEGLYDLTLPADDRLILSLHYYSPGWIYLQNCPWKDPDLNGEGYAGMTWRNIKPFVDNLENDFNYVREFQAANNDIPINIGEWGSVIYGDTANRRLYYTMLSRWFEDEGFSHTLWEYNHYFGIMGNPELTSHGTQDQWYNGFPEAAISDTLFLYAYDSTTVVQSNFASTSGWIEYENNGAVLNLSVSDVDADSQNELVIQVLDGGDGYQDARVYTPALNMDKDSIYRISYTIKTSSGTKTFAHKEAGWNTWYYTYDLGTTAKSVSETIVRDTTNTNTYYEFMVGGSTGTLYIDDLRIEKISPHTYLAADQPYIPVWNPEYPALDTIWFEDANTLFKSEIDVSDDCDKNAVIYETAFVPAGDAVTDTIGYLNFTYYHETATPFTYVSSIDKEDSVLLHTNVYFINTPKLNGGGQGTAGDTWPFNINYYEHFFNTDSVVYTIRGAGLDTANLYSVGVLSSALSATTRYLYMYIGSETASVNAAANDNNTATIDSITPVNNAIRIVFRKTAGMVGYLNALFLIETSPGTMVNDTNQAYVKFSNVQFGTTQYDSLYIGIDHGLVATDTSCYITLDSLDGDTLVMVTSPGTGCQTQFLILNDTISGTHDLYVTVDSLDTYVWMLFDEYVAPITTGSRTPLRSGAAQKILRGVTPYLFIRILGGEIVYLYRDILFDEQYALNLINNSYKR